MAAHDLRQNAETGPLLTAGSPMDGESENVEEEGAVMTLVEHLEELRRRLFICCLAVLVGTVVGFIFWKPLLDFLELPLPKIVSGIPNIGNSLVVNQLGGAFLIALKLAL